MQLERIWIELVDFALLCIDDTLGKIANLGMNRLRENNLRARDSTFMMRNRQVDKGDIGVLRRAESGDLRIGIRFTASSRPSIWSCRP